MPGVDEGELEIFVRPSDLAWGQGSVPATVTRVIDRPGSRRVLARLDDGSDVELEVPPETVVTNGERGTVRILRAHAFPLNR